VCALVTRVHACVNECVHAYVHDEGMCMHLRECVHIHVCMYVGVCLWKESHWIMHKP